MGAVELFVRVAELRSFRAAGDALAQGVDGNPATRLKTQRAELQRSALASPHERMVDPTAIMRPTGNLPGRIGIVKNAWWCSTGRSRPTTKCGSGSPRSEIWRHGVREIHAYASMPARAAVHGHKQ